MKIYDKGYGVLLSSGMIALLFFTSCTKDKPAKPPLLYAFFNADSTVILTGDTVHFSDESLGYPEKLSWSFDGGTPSSSTAEHPSVVYDSAGEYAVTLTVTNGSRTSVKIVKNYVSVKKAIDLNDNLVAFFPFNGSDADRGPGDLTVNVIGNVRFNGVDRHGQPNSAAVFDTGGLVIPDNALLNLGTSDFTVSCWIKTGQTSKMMIWQEAGSGGSRDNQTWLRIGDNTTSRLLRFDVEDSNGGTILNYGSGPESGVGDNNWHNVVCVREGSTTRLYIDGEKKGELNASAIKDVSNAEDFKIGMQEGPAGSFHTYFIGSLDDIRIYNKALSDLAIGLLYKQ